jgi:hypothetical protein
MDMNNASLQRAFEGLIGQSILEWRNGYGDSGSFHCGSHLPERSAAPRRKRGSWVLTIWEASVSLATQGPASASPRRPPTSLKELRLDRFEGTTIDSVSVGENGSIELGLGPSTRIEIEIDNGAESDEDQWTFETDGLGTFVMRKGPTLIIE